MHYIMNYEMIKIFIIHFLRCSFFWVEFSATDITVYFILSALEDLYYFKRVLTIPNTQRKLYYQKRIKERA